VIIYAGGLDIGLTAEVAAEAAALFPRAEVVVQPGAGHFPWLEDPGWFSAAMAKFLS
jgi:pimeloyl-ACP methyl ester carboxylesterase